MGAPTTPYEFGVDFSTIRPPLHRCIWWKEYRRVPTPLRSTFPLVVCITVNNNNNNSNNHYHYSNNNHIFMYIIYNNIVMSLTFGSV